MPRLRRRHNPHLALLIVVFGIEDATYEGAVHSCRINKLCIIRFLRKVQASLRLHAEPEPLSLCVAPSLRQYVSFVFRYIWAELVVLVNLPQLFNKHRFILRVDIAPALDKLLAVDGFVALRLLITLLVVHKLRKVDVKELRVLRRPPVLIGGPVFLCVIRMDNEGWQEVSQLNFVMQVAKDVIGRLSIWDVQHRCLLTVIWSVRPAEKLNTGEEERRCHQDYRADATKSGSETTFFAVVEFSPRAKLVFILEERFYAFHDFIF